MAGLLFFGGVAAEKSDPLPDGAVQNPVVRAHFRRVALEARAYVLPDGRRVYRRDFFLEDRVDRLVRHFLNQLIERRREFQSAVELAEKAQQRALHRRSNREAQRVLAAGLRQLAKRAARLRSLLRPVLSDFDSKADFSPQVTGDFADDGFEAELAFLRSEADATQQLIEDYFFEPRFTVEAGALKGGNMLVRLFQIKKLSEELADRLD